MSTNPISVKIKEFLLKKNNLIIVASNGSGCKVTILANCLRQHMGWQRINASRLKQLDCLVGLQIQQNESDQELSSSACQTIEQALKEESSKKSKKNNGRKRPK